MRTRSLLFTALLMVLLSCDDIIEPDISENEIEIVAPVNNASTDSLTLTFWWDEVKGASEYSIQIVSPAFENVIAIVADSVIEFNKFTYTFTPGSFQWRVKALNGGYNTEYSEIRSFQIKANRNLEKQVVKLLSPANNAYFNKNMVRFEWQKISIADEYRLIVEGAKTFDEAIKDNFYEMALEETVEGNFTWKVVAKNETSEKASDINSFILDRTPPSPSLIEKPLANEEVALPYKITWKRLSGDVASDSIYIYNTSKVLLDGFPKNILDVNFEIDNLAQSDYYVRLKSVDKAGNVSQSYSEEIKFTVQ